LDFEGNYQKFISTYYSKGFFTGGKLYRAYADYVGDKPTILKNMRKYLTVIKKYKKSGTLLDLGCAMGFLIQEADKWKFESFGVDISSYAVEIAQKLVGKNKVTLGKVEELDKLALQFDKTNLGKFDIITMFDLIEHLENPRIVLQKITKVLKDNGLIVIQTGDAGSMWTKFMGKNWHFFAPPQHFFFYSKNNIKELLSQSGFEVVKIQKMGKWVSLRYLFHMMRYINKDSIGDILYNFTAKNFIGQIPVFMRMNDNMIVIGRKKSGVKNSHQTT
jgi:SAM-dependent methyltransferase